MKKGPQVRKKDAIQTWKKEERQDFGSSRPEGSEQGGEGGKAPKFSIANKVKVEKDLSF